jgi:hypothetical protein
MKDNDLSSIAIQPMSTRHFQIVSDLVGRTTFSKVVQQAVSAIFVNQNDPEATCRQFALTPGVLIEALKSYSDAWDNYCEENELVTGVFWLPPEIAERAKAIEARALTRIERRRKRSVELSTNVAKG